MVSKKVLAMIGLGLVFGEIALVLLSWILSAAGVEGVRSLLSTEGVRWFFGNFTQMVGDTPLVWLLVLLIAFGCLQQSGLLSMQKSFRDRLALRVAVVLLVAYVGIILLLTVVPHAILLSATGHLFPSAFSRSLVPILAFGVMLVSIAFGMMSGRMPTAVQVLDALSYGLVQGAPFIVLYILAAQLCHSLAFVFL